jgi:cbb3-type cytochrome oxidase subunit 3
MFKQFLENVDGNQGYLLSSLGIFLLFFILVGVYILTIKKEEINYMSELPLNDNDNERGS